MFKILVEILKFFNKIRIFAIIIQNFITGEYIMSKEEIKESSNEKQKKGKSTGWWIFIAIIVIGGHLLGFGEDDESTKENKKDTKTEVTAENKKETKGKLSEKEINYYKKTLAPELDKYQKEYDRIWEEQWQVTLDAITNGNVSMYQAYKNMKTIHSNYSNLSTAFSSIEIKNLSGENKELIENYKEKMSKAANYRGHAARRMAELIDNGNFKPSKIESVQSYIALADEEMIAAAVERATLENNLGLIKKENQEVSNMECPKCNKPMKLIEEGYDYKGNYKVYVCKTCGEEKRVDLGK